MIRSAALFVTLALLACRAPAGEEHASPAPPASDGGLPESRPPDGATEPPPLDVRVDGAFARAAHPLPQGGLLVLHETPVHLKTAWGYPRRRAVWLDALGKELHRQEAAPSRELLDAVVHPSGEVTLLEASKDGYILSRVDDQRTPRGETKLVDDAILTDPPAITPAESRSPIEEHTHDAARIAADGEDVFVGARTGRHSVIAYRAHWTADGGFAVAARTLVVPAYPITATALNGGSYDTFGQLDAHYGVFVAVDPATGLGWVGVGHARLENGAMVKAHAKVFGETLATDPDFLDAFVSRVARDGTRLGTSVISTPNDEQLYALRAADRDGVYALGRTERWNAEGTGFDGLVAHVGIDGSVSTRTVDVERSDIVFDVAPVKEGLLVVGASGYWQNPNGASISEESHVFARLLRADGTSEVAPLDLAVDGPRHNEARFLVPGRAPGEWIAGGMLDGPGTHSADSDAALLRATGFVKALRVRR